MARRIAKRIYRELTPEEEARVEATRRAVEGEKEELLAKAKQYRKLDESKRPAPKKTRGTLGERLKQLRERRQLTQQEVATAAAATLATRLPMTATSLQSTLSQIERGTIANPGVLTLDALCAAIGVPLAEVLESR